MKRLSTTAGVPKHLLAEKSILDAIRSGRFPPGSQLPGERELACTLQASVVTVQTALRRLCTRRVLERRPRVGTFVRASAHAPDVAILVLNDQRLDLGISKSLHQEMQDEGLARGHQVRTMLLARPYPALPQLRDELEAMRIGAVGILDFLDSDRDYIAALADLMPCVLLNKGISGLPLPCAGVDTFAAARQIAEFFAQRGRKRIAAGVFHLQHQRFAELRIAIEAECTRLGIEVDKRLWGEGTSFDPRVAVDWMDRLPREKDRPDALVWCANYGPQVLRDWMTRTGLTFGEDLDAVVFRLSQASQTPPVPWAWMVVDDHLILMNGLRMLFDLTEGKDTGANAVVRVKPEFVMPGQPIP